MIVESQKKKKKKIIIKWAYPLMSKIILYWTKSYCNLHIAALINFKKFRTDERPITIGKETFPFNA